MERVVISPREVPGHARSADTQSMQASESAYRQAFCRLMNSLEDAQRIAVNLEDKLTPALLPLHENPCPMSSPPKCTGEAERSKSSHTNDLEIAVNMVHDVCDRLLNISHRLDL